jgi:hypothetical protein
MKHLVDRAGTAAALVTASMPTQRRADRSCADFSLDSPLVKNAATALAMMDEPGARQMPTGLAACCAARSMHVGWAAREQGKDRAIFAKKPALQLDADCESEDRKSGGE